MHNLHKLWVKMFSNKYLNGNNILQAHIQHDAYYVFNVIVKIVNIIQRVILIFPKGLSDISLLYIKGYILVFFVNMFFCPH